MNNATDQNNMSGRLYRIDEIDHRHASSPSNTVVYLWAFAVAVVVFIVYWPALSNGFVYDDELNLLDHDAYRGLGVEQFRWMLTAFHAGHYQPLTWFSYAIDHQLWGMNPKGYHLTNNFIHAINAALVYFLALTLFRLSRSPHERSRSITHGANLAAALVAILFAVHPLRVESVAWITERRDVLSAMFMLLTVLVYLHTHGKDRPRSTLNYFAYALFLVSLLAKAGGMVLPFVLLVLDFYPLKRFVRADQRGADDMPPVVNETTHRNTEALFEAAGKTASSHRASTVLKEKIPFLVTAGVFAFLAAVAQTQADATAEFRDHSFIERCAQASFGLVFYLYKTIWPTALLPLYELHLPVDVGASKYVISMIIIGVGALLFVFFVLKKPAVAAVIACYVLFLVPVLGFFQSGSQEVADRYSYTATIGWFVLLGAGYWRLLEAGSKRHTFAIPATGLLVSAVVVSAYLTFQQNTVWRSNITLWTHATNYASDSRIAHKNLGSALEQAGRLEAAANAYQRARKIAPLYPEFGYARCMMKLGQSSQAIEDIKAILVKLPTNAEARELLAIALYETGEADLAILHMKEYLSLKPGNHAARRALVTWLLEQGRMDQASIQMELLSAASEVGDVATQIDHLENEPQTAEGKIKRADRYAAVGRIDNAIALYENALKYQPEDAITHYKLGSLLSDLGRYEQAIESLKQALTFRPEFPEAHVALGQTFAQLDDPQNARSHYQQAVQLYPEYLSAHYNLGIVQGHLGELDAAMTSLENALRLARQENRLDLIPRIEDRLDRFRNLQKNRSNP